MQRISGRRGPVLAAAALLLACAAAPGRPARAEDLRVLQGADAPAGAAWLDALDLGKVTQSWGKARAGRSVDDHPMSLHGVTYAHGIGTHASSEFAVDLHGAAARFSAMVGVDDERPDKGSVTFAVVVDGKTVARTGVLRGGDAPQLLSVDLTGARKLVLRVGDGGDDISDDHADWAGALITLAGGASAQPTAADSAVPAEPARLVVPAPDPRPAFHGARVVGATPGHPFLFRIPATGEGPLTFAAKGLPAGITLDPATGILSGTLKAPGVSKVTVTVRGAKGEARRGLTVVGGEDRLALTPPMGWNSWNLWATKVDADKVRAAADAMADSGLAAHGFQYVNIDDAWEGTRDAQGNIQTNAKFPDMKGLADYVHSKGLKLGIYSSPGPWTCGGYAGSFGHEAQDARTYAAWGIDYLKYDYCSYAGAVARNVRPVPVLRWPYLVMRSALGRVDRDIVYSFCQYGKGDVWNWGTASGANSWRTTDDINDHWDSVRGILSKQATLSRYAGPGHWNDPDMLVVGTLGWGNLHPSRLTPNEQLLHISMWCMLSSPLLIGCDMTRMDDLTRALLTNDEVLDVNQDPMGRPALLLREDGAGGEVWARPLFDGTHAVALVNGEASPQAVTVAWSELGVSGRQRVRDLWLHKDLGTLRDRYSVTVPAHGVVLLKVGAPRRGADTAAYVPDLTPAAPAPAVPPVPPAMAAAPAAPRDRAGDAPSADRYDFGEAAAAPAAPGGAVLSHTFLIENTGKTPLVLERLETSCRCTSADFLGGDSADAAAAPLPRTVAPGEAARVRVTVDTAILGPGPVDKYVWVYARGNAAPFRTLEVSGTLPKAAQ